MCSREVRSLCGFYEVGGGKMVPAALHFNGAKETLVRWFGGGCGEGDENSVALSEMCKHA